MNKTKTQIAYRCPECGMATVGFFSGFADVSDMLRLRCKCNESALEIKKQRDEKIRLSVPCVYCKSSHSYTFSDSIAKREEITKISCPYANMDISFIGNAEDVSRELERTALELERVIKSFEGEELSDIQPKDADDDEMASDPSVFDAINFLVRDLEDEGGIFCPCGKGPYPLRFCDGGIQVYCESCGASYTFYARTAAAAEEYLGYSEIRLK